MTKNAFGYAVFPISKHEQLKHASICHSCSQIPELVFVYEVGPLTSQINVYELTLHLISSLYFNVSLVIFPPYNATVF
jgi:hypothetical protein